MTKGKLLISFSGGRTSAYMTWFLLTQWERRNQYEMLVVFANTGKEREETLRFVQQCDEHFGFNVIWVEAVTNNEKGKGVVANVVTYDTASRNGEPFEAMIAKHGLPNINSSHCSRELKERAIRNYLRSIGWNKYVISLGIRADEPSRLNWERVNKGEVLYPLATIVKTTKNDVNAFWSRQPFDLRLKSYEGNCDMCFKKSLRKLMTIYKNNPELIEWWKEIENKYGRYIPATRAHNIKITLPIKLYREGNSAGDLIEEAGFPFDPARDESKDINTQLSFWTYELDTNSGCVESCEAF